MPLVLNMTEGTQYYIRYKKYKRGKRYKIYKNDKNNKRDKNKDKKDKFIILFDISWTRDKKDVFSTTYY